MAVSLADLLIAERRVEESFVRRSRHSGRTFGCVRTRLQTLLQAIGVVDERGRCDIVVRDGSRGARGCTGLGINAEALGGDACFRALTPHPLGGSSRVLDMSSGRPGESEMVPVGVLDGRYLADLGGDLGKTELRKARDIDANVQCLVGSKLREDAARHDVQRLEKTHDARERAGITIRPDAQAQQLRDVLNCLFCNHGNSSSSHSDLNRTRANPGFL